MKDDILTAVADYGSCASSVAPNVAPIAPLPSRLSFCLSPQRQQQLDTLLMAEHQPDNSPIKKADLDEQEIISPSKKLLNSSHETSSSCGLSVAVKRSPTVAPSVVPRLVAKAAAAASDIVIEAEVITHNYESPTKRKLRMSVSCDNYLGDGKFSLSRRDSVGSGSPHSSKVKLFFERASFQILSVSFFKSIHSVQHLNLVQLIMPLSSVHI